MEYLNSFFISYGKGVKLHCQELYPRLCFIVNANIEKGAIAVDMIASSFFTIANVYKKKTAAILTVADNLITGELGFLDPGFIEAQKTMIDIAFKTVEESNVC